MITDIITDKDVTEAIAILYRVGESLTAPRERIAIAMAIKVLEDELSEAALLDMYTEEEVRKVRNYEQRNKH